MNTPSENHTLSPYNNIQHDAKAQTYLLEAEAQAVMPGFQGVHCTNQGGAIRIKCGMSGALLELDYVPSPPESHQGAPHL